MRPHISAFRAISAELATSLVKPLVIVAGIILLVIILLIWLLAAQLSAWWLLLFVPVGILSIIVGLFSLIAWLIIKIIRPDLSRDQRQAVKDFTDKVSELSETIRTPYPLLLARAGIDLIIHRDGRYVRGLISDSQSLKGEYQAIQKYFDLPPASDKSEVV